jgi:putative hydrolase of the HAD superfamily
MLRAVIFDWFGTLAHWQHDAPSNYTSVFESFGHTPPPGLIDEYHRRWDGVDHREHSVDQTTYLAWTKSRLGTLVTECGVENDLAEKVTDALLRSDAEATMELYPDALPVLRELRGRSIAIGICSNWGWDLRTYLQATGVAAFVDTAVTSARAGYRKPHSGIYQVILNQLEVPASEAIFVGDSWEPDVIGPLEFGIAAVHIHRQGSVAPPELTAGSYRITTLYELLELPILAAEGDPIQRT